MPISKMQGAS